MCLASACQLAIRQSAYYSTLSVLCSSPCPVCRSYHWQLSSAVGLARGGQGTSREQMVTVEIKGLRMK